MTYTAHRINLDGSLSHKEHLNNRNEMLDWVGGVYGMYANIRITNDQTGEIRNYTDNGERFVCVA